MSEINDISILHIKTIYLFSMVECVFCCRWRVWPWRVGIDRRRERRGQHFFMASPPNSERAMAGVPQTRRDQKRPSALFSPSGFGPVLGGFGRSHQQTAQKFFVAMIGRV